MELYPFASIAAANGREPRVYQCAEGKGSSLAFCGAGFHPQLSSMASALSMSATTSAAGLGGSSLTGQKLRIKPAVVSTRRASQVARVGVATAKYGDKSVYFDLEDIGNTTGYWDLYGSDGASPYNGLQSQFFQIAAGAFTKRGLLLKFLVLGFAGSLAYTGSSADPNYLPIKKGPQGPGEPGPGGKI